jgi:hypothetical protein
MANKKLLKIQRVSEYIKQNHECPEAARKTAQYVAEALIELNDSSRSRSNATAHAGLILQAICWLCKAQTCTSDKDESTHLHGICVKGMATLMRLLQQRTLTLEQLRPVLQPCPEDGVTPGGHDAVQWLQVAQAA